MLIDHDLTIEAEELTPSMKNGSERNTAHLQGEYRATVSD